MVSTIMNKAFRVIRRDRLILVLTLICAPFFIFLYKLIFMEGMTVYNILLYVEIPYRSEQVIDYLDNYRSELESIKYPGGGTLFQFQIVENRTEGLDILKNHDAHLMAVFKDDFFLPPEIKIENRSPPEIILIGDHSNPYYVLSSKIFRDALTELFISSRNMKPVIVIEQEAIGISHLKTEFENYVPGLIIFSTLILIFIFSILLTREVESNVFIRYRLCGLSARDYIAGHSFLFMIMSVVTAFLSLLTAFICGFTSPISLIYDLALSLLICSVLGLTVIGIVFVIVSLAQNVIQAFLISTFPFMLLVFFSGSVYPFPKITLLEIAGRHVGLFDFLPATHAVAALHKILTFGTSPGELVYELSALLILSLIIFFFGILFFSRRKLGKIGK